MPVCVVIEGRRMREREYLQQWARIMEVFTEKGPAKFNFPITKRSMSKETSVRDISTSLHLK